MTTLECNIKPTIRARATTSHPLDMIALFRRWPPSPVRDLVYTGVWNCVIALVLTVAYRMLSGAGKPVAADWWPILLISNLAGFMIHLTMAAVNRLTNGWPARVGGLTALVYNVTVVATCVVLGIALGLALQQGTNPLAYLLNSATLALIGPFALVIAIILAMLFAAGARRERAEMAAARQSEQIAASARLLAEARLRTLQAQIEPHFLYNALANVMSLIMTQPAQAHHMLERFIAYLRASLAASRANDATLGAEADLIAAYLDVLAVRMGVRLRYRIEIADALRPAWIAPMLLQPLVENAIAHGLEPKVDGGEIVLSARAEGAMLRVEVSDDGVGLQGGTSAKPDGGVGLANLRERLRSIYGDAARLQLIENPAGGICVRLQLPRKESAS